MGKLDGRVALISGAARGQGRSHAIRLAEEGAQIIAFDICTQIATVPYAMATLAELEETAEQVRSAGGSILVRQADARDADAVQTVVNEGVAQFGRLDMVIGNAGICSMKVDRDDALETFRDTIDVNVTGIWNTTRAAVPAMVAAGRGGSIVLTSSTAGMRGSVIDNAGYDAYTMSKHAMVGLMRNLANRLAPHNIRVNTIHPTGVNTAMLMSGEIQQVLQSVPAERSESVQNLLPLEMMEPVDVSQAVLWLVSDESRYVTGTMMPIDAGYAAKA